MQPNTATIKAVEASMHNALSRSAIAYNTGADTVDNGRDVFNRLGDGIKEVREALEAEGTDNAASKSALLLDPNTFTEFTTTVEAMGEAFTEAEMARLEGEQHLHRLIAMTAAATELPAQERTRLGRIIKAAQTNVSQFRALIKKRQDFLNFLDTFFFFFNMVHLLRRQSHVLGQLKAPGTLL
ncbi:hypothetical protein PHYPSEUDO_001346 [Phytophthora pseudosyringae]|uniref:Uncharacterized protein n=1 Tax=Phytophthora pseudosyringae TaxID=221518 RepID=A0A8T1WDQ9_9STRA|nr:hypothetical protein PHYPSEUDO_001346 [Phytophthora pseudosyringae]